MTRVYSMDGFDIRVRGDILEMRTEGVRTEQMGLAAERAFKQLIDEVTSKGILFDLREAHYLMNEDEWEQRLGRLARTCRNHLVAFVARGDQVVRMRQACDAHRAEGGESEIFRARATGREWLRQSIDEREMV